MLIVCIAPNERQQQVVHSGVGGTEATATIFCRETFPSALPLKNAISRPPFALIFL